MDRRVSASENLSGVGRPLVGTEGTALTAEIIILRLDDSYRLSLPTSEVSNLLEATRHYRRLPREQSFEGAEDALSTTVLLRYRPYLGPLEIGTSGARGGRCIASGGLAGHSFPQRIYLHGVLIASPQSNCFDHGLQDRARLFVGNTVDKGNTH